MSYIQGTNVAAPIVPYDTLDTYPTHDSQYGVGGWHEVNTYADRDAITNQRRRDGMVVYVKSDTSHWQLQNGVWVPFSTGGTSFTVTAGQNINAYQVVAMYADGLARIADANTLNDISRVIGLATTSALSGATLRVQQLGYVKNLGWSWTPGQTVFLGLNGALVTSPNAGAFELSLGTTLSVSELEVQIGLPIILA